MLFLLIAILIVVAYSAFQVLTILTFLKTSLDDLNERIAEMRRKRPGSLKVSAK